MMERSEASEACGWLQDGENYAYFKSAAAFSGF